MQAKETEMRLQEWEERDKNAIPSMTHSLLWCLPVI